LSAEVHEVTQYSAYCVECHVEGAVWNDNEAFADHDAAMHNYEKHGGPKPAEEPFDD
jgi:hypothetical protein